MAQRRFTLGISVEHFDFRVDLHRFIETMSEFADVVVFTDRPFKETIKGIKEVRLYKSRRCLTEWLASRFFIICRRLPKSRNNFFLTELYNLALLPPAQQRRGRFYLWLRRLIPWGIPVDAILPWLGGGDATPLEDVDAFLHVTRIGDLPFLQRTLASGKPNAAYVYSWDHPCKHTTIPRRGLRTYFTWNRQLSEDLANLQNVPIELTKVVGATQLCPLKKYLETPAARERLIQEEYVYYGCGTSQGDLVRQEVLVIQHLAKSLQEVKPELTLLVRPYPLLQDWKWYDPLRNLPNVKFDWFRKEGQGRELTAAQVFEKYNKIEHARAFVHVGTTLGWEACYFETPVLFLSLDDADLGRQPGSLYDLRRFTHQFHNDRHLALPGFANVVKRTAELTPALRGSLEKPEDFLAYNRAVAGATPLRSMEAIVSDVLQGMETDPAH